MSSQVRMGKIGSEGWIGSGKKFIIKIYKIIIVLKEEI